MTVTTSVTGTRIGQRLAHVVRRAALLAGWFVGAIGSRWNDFVDSGQLGPSQHQYVSRHTGSRF